MISKSAGLIHKPSTKSLHDIPMLGTIYFSPPKSLAYFSYNVLMLFSSSSSYLSFSSSSFSSSSSSSSNNDNK